MDRICCLLETSKLATQLNPYMSVQDDCLSIYKNVNILFYLKCICKIFDIHGVTGLDI